MSDFLMILSKTELPNKNTETNRINKTTLIFIFYDLKFTLFCGKITANLYIFATQ